MTGPADAALRRMAEGLEARRAGVRRLLATMPLPCELCPAMLEGSAALLEHWRRMHPDMPGLADRLRVRPPAPPRKSRRWPS